MTNHHVKENIYNKNADLDDSGKPIQAVSHSNVYRFAKNSVSSFRVSNHLQDTKDKT